MKTKKLFIVGIAMFALLLAYIAFDMFVPSMHSWRYNVTWIIFYVYSSLMVLTFILHAVLRGRDIAKDTDNRNTEAWAGVWGGIGCALLSFEFCFIWFAINRPQLNGPEWMSLACPLYFIFTIVILMIATVLKIRSRD